MAGLADGERGEDDADAGVGFASFFLEALPGAGMMDTGGDAGRLCMLGEPGCCAVKSASSEEDPESQSTSSDV